MSHEWTAQLCDRVLELLSYNPAEPMIFSSGVFLWLFGCVVRICKLN